MGRKLRIFTTRLAALLVLHAVGAGYASPTVLVTRPESRHVEWLPTDNQTVYRLKEGETRRKTSAVKYHTVFCNSKGWMVLLLFMGGHIAYHQANGMLVSSFDKKKWDLSLEMNTSSISQAIVFITISPCTKDFHWALYYGKAGNANGHLSLQKENSNGEMSMFSLLITSYDKYVLQLSSTKGGACVVSARGEAPRQVRLRLRVRSRRRLAANWDPSPIDPNDTSYCVVASHRKNYTSLCAAQHDIKTSRLEKSNTALSQKFEHPDIANVSSEDNKIDMEDSFNIYEGHFKSVYRKKKFGRSTKVTTDEDPVIACVGERTHHLIENLDPSTMYFVSVFGVARDRRSGSLLATGSVRPRTSTAKRLRENMPHRADVRGKNVYYFKATIGAGGGLWLTVTTCGGSVDVEVLVRGKRLYFAKNIDPHSKFFVAAPMMTSSIQETSDEGSVQFDSSSEETRMRYVIKVVPTRWDRDSAVNVEVTASTTRWGINTPELLGDGAIVRELRPRRSCRSVDIAFLPATHNATEVIRYCTTVRETMFGEAFPCLSLKKVSSKTQCLNQMQRTAARVIVQKIGGLKAGRKYAIQVTASSKGSLVPYNVLYVDTNVSCKED